MKIFIDIISSTKKKKKNDYWENVKEENLQC